MTGPISSSFFAGIVPFLNTNRLDSTSSGPIPVRALMSSQPSSPGAGPAGPAAGAAAAAGAGTETGFPEPPAAADLLASGTLSSAPARRLPVSVFCWGECAR